MAGISLRFPLCFWQWELFPVLQWAAGGNEISKEFIGGAKDILTAALIVGLAGGIIVVLQDGKIMDTILYSLSNACAEPAKGEQSLSCMQFKL
jgi:uncharacterized ion transporter superfamily protein YfcC